MPTKKTIAKKIVKKTQTQGGDLVLSEISTKSSFSKPSLNKKTAIILLIIGILILAVLNKSFFIAATVNNSPITNLELLMRLNSQYREQTLTEMINERVILGEASKKGIIVNKSDVDTKVSGIESSVGGAAALDSLLAQQGQTRDGLRKQLSIQLTIEKLYSDEATVSAAEVDQFITQNKDQLKASDSAGQITEATDALKQQKLSQIFNDKFQALKQAANIKIF